jgi:sulfite reductase (ferredoxin)
LAQIGFHGSSFKVGTHVVPALQLLLGGGTIGNGQGRTGDKIIKVASKRGPDLLRSLLSDFKTGSTAGESFNQYYDRKGKDYFYQLLKPLGDNSSLTEKDFIDWGQEEKFQTAIGVGECAGVVIDLIATLFLEAEEKLDLADAALKNAAWGDSLYYSYATFIHAAKALLLDKNIHTNTQHGVLNEFEKHFVETGTLPQAGFKDLVLSINKQEASPEFAGIYYEKAKAFLKQVIQFRDNTLAVEKS